MKKWSQYLQAMIGASMLTTYYKQMESYILMKLFLLLMMIHMFEIFTWQIYKIKWFTKAS
jgi:hypothetical protein